MSTFIAMIIIFIVVICFFFLNISVPRQIHVRSLYRRLYFINRTIQWLCPYPNETSVRKVLYNLESEKKRLKRK
jgi:hypothetical protein